MLSPMLLLHMVVLTFVILDTKLMYNKAYNSPNTYALMTPLVKYSKFSLNTSNTQQTGTSHARRYLSHCLEPITMDWLATRISLPYQRANDPYSQPPAPHLMSPWLIYYGWYHWLQPPKTQAHSHQQYLTIPPCQLTLGDHQTYWKLSHQSHFEHTSTIYRCNISEQQSQHTLMALTAPTRGSGMENMERDYSLDLHSNQWYHAQQSSWPLAPPVPSTALWMGMTYSPGHTNTISPSPSCLVPIQQPLPMTLQTDIPCHMPSTSPHITKHPPSHTNSEQIATLSSLANPQYWLFWYLNLQHCHPSTHSTKAWPSPQPIGHNTCGIPLTNTNPLQHCKMLSSKVNLL